MRRVIHIGEGKHIEIEEGTLLASPPKPHLTEEEAYWEWRSMRNKQMLRLNPNVGKIQGHAWGMTIEQVLDAKFRVQELVRKDMEAIKKAGIELDVAAEEALTTTLTIMRSDGETRTKLAAARQVLEWTKAKPVSKSEVTVNSAEAWLASLAQDEDD